MAEILPAPDHDGDGKAFQVITSNVTDIRVDQIAHEVGALHGWGNDVGNWNYYWGADLEHPILWTSRKDVDPTKMARAARNHKRNPNFVDPNLAPHQVNQP